jgi:hypothetical protein
MTDSFERVLRERFEAQADPLPGLDFGDVRARARGSVRRLRRPRRRGLVAALVAAAVIGGGATALAYHYLGPSPGFTAGFSAFDRLPSAVPEPAPAVGLDHMAAYLGLTEAEAAQRWRLLQTGLTLGVNHSQGEGKLYGLIGDSGTACVVLVGQGGSCINAAAADSAPGVLYQVLPGYPGQTPAVVALVADNVDSVALVVSSQNRDIPIVNNSIYADLTGVQACDKLSLTVGYGDGSTRAFALHNSLDDESACTSKPTQTAPQIDRGPMPHWPVLIGSHSVLGQQLVLQPDDLPAGFNGRDARAVDALDAGVLGPRSTVAQQLRWGRLTGYSITFDKKSGEHSYLAGVVSAVSVYGSAEGAREAMTANRICTQSGLYDTSLGALPGDQSFACELRLPLEYLVAWRQGPVVSSIRASSFSAGELRREDVVSLARTQAARVAKAIGG